jgi:hypothetical protein
MGEDRMLGSTTKHRLAAVGGVIVALSAVAALAATSRPVEPRESVATIDRAQGDAIIERNGVRSPVASGQQISRRDNVETGKGARVSLTFNDGSKVSIGENALLVVADFIAEEGRRSGALILDLLRGPMRLMASKPLKAPDKRIEVRTPVATLTTQGADVWSGPVDDHLGVMVMAGNLDVRNDAGWVVLDKRRQGTLVLHRTIAPERPVVWAAERTTKSLLTVAFK